MTLSDKSKEILASLWQLDKSLKQVIPSDLTEYIIELIAKDQAHQKYLNITKED